MEYVNNLSIPIIVDLEDISDFTQFFTWLLVHVEDISDFTQFFTFCTLGGYQWLNPFFPNVQLKGISDFTQFLTFSTLGGYQWLHPFFHLLYIKKISPAIIPTLCNTRLIFTVDITCSLLMWRDIIDIFTCHRFYWDCVSAWSTTARNNQEHHGVRCICRVPRRHVWPCT